MVCPYCGKPMRDGSNFCDYCGMFTEQKIMPEPKMEAAPEDEENMVLKNLFSPELPTAAPEKQKKKKPVLHVSKQANVIILAACLLVLLFIAFNFVRGLGRRRGVAGIGEPIQTETTGYVQKDVAGYDVAIYLLYEYEIEALVVHTKRYSGFGIASRLAPVDAALAWGKVAEFNDRVDFHWKQSGRWYFWSVSSYESLARLGSGRWRRDARTPSTGKSWKR